MRLVKPVEAAEQLGVSYPTIKQWIYRHKIKSIKTEGGHHRIPQAEIDRFIHRSRRNQKDISKRREDFRKISGRNQLIGRVTQIKVDGLMAQVKLSVGGQTITSIITADAVREMELRVGEVAAALVKSTEVMIVKD